MENQEQAEEMEAMKAIFGEEEFISRLAEDKGQYEGEIYCPVDLVDKITVACDGLKYPVSFLPPLTIKFRLPGEYPSQKPPTFKLFCCWLSDKQLVEVARGLEASWEMGQVVLFHWTQWVQNEMIPLLGIGAELDLNQLEGAEDPRLVKSTQTPSTRLRLILDHDRRMKEKDYLSSAHMCGICFEEKLGKDCLKFFSCEHIFCRECLGGYFTSQIQSRAVKFLLCPNTACKKQALPTEVRSVVPAPLFAKYEELLLQSALEEMDDIIWCPRDNCQFPVIRDANNNLLGECSKCRYAFCVRCQRSWHALQPCLPSNFKKLVQDYLNGTEETRAELERIYGGKIFKRAVEDFESQRWMTSNAQKCPKCASVVQKSSGCNKMTCSVCHSYFCYLCGKGLPASNPYSHFNEKSTCEGRLFDGIEDDEDDFF